MKKKICLLVLIILYNVTQFYAVAQDIQVNGRISDETKAPVPDATISIKGKGKSTVSAKDGRFSIVANGSDILVISSVGYAGREVNINGQQNIEIELTRSVGQLGEVVVTALGVRREKRNLTYSTQELKGETLTQAKEPNIVNAMAGKVSGVQITSSSGTAGAASRIVIRGATSPQGDNQPLFVVDGIPVNNDETSNTTSGPGSNRIIDIDPSIIENITVLKGAAATALYGSSGAKGVVMITTKSGSMDKKPSVSFTSELSFEKPWIPERQRKYGQGIDGIFYNGEDQKTSASWGPLMDTLKINGSPAPVYDPWDSFLRKGITTNNTVSLSGGNTNSGYFFSYSYFDQQGYIPKNDFKRHSLFAKYNTRITKNLNTVFQLGYTNSDQSKLPEATGIGPLYVLLVQPISWNPYPILNPDGSQRNFRFSRNPASWSIDNVHNNSVVNRFIPVLTVNYTPTNWLTVTERAGADLYTEQDKYYNSPSPLLGPPDSENPDASGSVRNQNINFRQFNNDLIINAHKQFNKLDLNLLLGNNIYTNYSQYINLTGRRMTIEEFNNVSTAARIESRESYYQQRKVGFYAQANIEYNKLLALSLTGRYDGSSVLSQDKQFYPYGSAALSFIFSELLPSWSKVMNFGKLRLSYATVGNDAVGPYQLGTPYELAVRSSGSFPFQGQPGFLLSSFLGNPSLKNERLNEYEAGLEARFLNNRLGIEASYFYRKSIDGIIPNVTISNATGYSSTAVNSASIENKGFELLLNANPVKNKNFSWDLTFNFSRIRSKVLALYPGLNQLGRLIVGQPYNIFYGTMYERNADGKLLVDASGAPFISTANGGLGIIGNANPDWLAGINNSLRYKQFSLNFFFDKKQGGDIMNNVTNLANFYGTSKVTENRAPLVVDGISVVDNKPNTVAIPAQTYYRNVWQLAESSIEDGSFIKLRTASLSYFINPSLLSGTFVKAASLTVTGRNLWIHSPHFTGADPEVGSLGTGNSVVGIYEFSVPTARSVNFTLKLGF